MSLAISNVEANDTTKIVFSPCIRLEELAKLVRFMLLVAEVSMMYNVLNNVK